MNKQLNFEVKGHTFTATFPTTNNYLKIHNLKASLSPHYDALLYMGTESSFATIVVDTIAHLTVMCPELVKSLQKPMSELELSELVELSEVYSSKVRPWYNELMNFIFKAPEELKKTEVDTNV